MSETTTSVPMDDAALFGGAIANEAPAEAAPATPEAPAHEATTEQQPEETGQPRDEHGRFAPKVEAEAPAEAAQVDQQQPKDTAIPAWRVSEIAEARRAAEARATETELRAQQLELQTRQLTEQLRQYTEKQQDPIDPYADPERFRDAGVRQAVDPIRNEISQLREHYSRENAFRVFGEETVREAYKWLETGTRTGDPRVAPVLQRAMSSIDPYKDIVTAFKRDKALATVGDDPNAWFEKEFARRSAEDPQFAAKLKPNGAPQQQSIVKLPPSLSRVSGAAEAAPLAMDDASLFANAIK